MNPDFTIVTASYNYGRYIDECLASVAQQEGVTLEHLVMDAGSTDDTKDIVARYPHATFFQEPDEGMSDGINKGFRKAQGRWVMWLNADDRLKPGALKAVKDFAERKPDADVIYGAWNFVDEQGTFIRRMTLFPFSRSMLFNLGCYIASTSTFFRKATTIDAGFLLNVRFKAVMDGEYFCRLAKTGKQFVHLSRVLADFRWHGQGLSQQYVQRADIDGVLSRQLQLAESTTLRRVYGVKLFRDEIMNMVVEGVLCMAFRAWKAILRILYRPGCKDAE